MNSYMTPGMPGHFRLLVIASAITLGGLLFVKRLLWRGLTGLCIGCVTLSGLANDVGVDTVITTSATAAPVVANIPPPLMKYGINVNDAWYRCAHAAKEDVNYRTFDCGRDYKQTPVALTAFAGVGLPADYKAPEPKPAIEGPTFPITELHKYQNQVEKTAIQLANTTTHTVMAAPVLSLVAPPQWLDTPKKGKAASHCAKAYADYVKLKKLGSHGNTPYPTNLPAQQAALGVLEQQSCQRELKLINPVVAPTRQ